MFIVLNKIICMSIGMYDKNLQCLAIAHFSFRFLMMSWFCDQGPPVLATWKADCKTLFMYWWNVLDRRIRRTLSIPSSVKTRHAHLSHCFLDCCHFSSAADYFFSQQSSCGMRLASVSVTLMGAAAALKKYENYHSLAYYQLLKESSNQTSTSQKVFLALTTSYCF